MKSGGFRKRGYGKIKKLGTKLGIHKTWIRKLGKDADAIFQLAKKKSGALRKEDCCPWRIDHIVL